MEIYIYIFIYMCVYTELLAGKGSKRPLPLSVAPPSFRHFALAQNDGKVMVSQVREHESQEVQIRVCICICIFIHICVCSFVCSYVCICIGILSVLVFVLGTNLSQEARNFRVESVEIQKCRYTTVMLGTKPNITVIL